MNFVPAHIFRGQVQGHCGADARTADEYVLVF